MHFRRVVLIPFNWPLDIDEHKQVIKHTRAVCISFVINSQIVLFITGTYIDGLTGECKSLEECSCKRSDNYHPPGDTVHQDCNIWLVNLKYSTTLYPSDKVIVRFHLLTGMKKLHT